MKRSGYLAWGVAIVLLVTVVAVGFWRPWETSAGPRPWRIALVQLTTVDSQTVAGFKAGMVAAGYHEGRDVVYLDSGPVGAMDRLEPVIRGHLARRPDLILVSSTPATQAVLRLVRGQAIPVVFAPVNDPVGAGVVADLRHPGGRVTGIRLPTGDDLRLHWLQELAPATRRVWVPYTPGDSSAQTSLTRIRQAASILGLTLVPTPARGEVAIQAAMPAGVDAIFLPRDSSIESLIRLFVKLAEGRRIPLCVPSLTQVEAGALFSYGFSHQEIGLRAARQAVQIFKGVSPGDLPVETAENVLSINLASALRIGLDIPDTILLQAERVIRD